MNDGNNKGGGLPAQYGKGAMRDNECRNGKLACRLLGSVLMLHF